MRRETLFRLVRTIQLSNYSIVLIEKVPLPFHTIPYHGITIRVDCSMVYDSYRILFHSVHRYSIVYWYIHIFGNDEICKLEHFFFTEILRKISVLI